MKGNGRRKRKGDAMAEKAQVQAALEAASATLERWRSRNPERHQAYMHARSALMDRLREKRKKESK